MKCKQRKQNKSRYNRYLTFRGISSCNNITKHKRLTHQTCRAYVHYCIWCLFVILYKQSLQMENLHTEKIVQKHCMYVNTGNICQPGWRCRNSSHCFCHWAEYSFYLVTSICLNNPNRNQLNRSISNWNSCNFGVAIDWDLIQLHNNLYRKLHCSKPLLLGIFFHL